MKSLDKIQVFCIVSFMALAFLVPEKAVSQRYSAITMQTFYDELSPYGRWIHNPQYGYVWLPDAEPHFQPYATRGYWVMTEYGNTWVSDYAWGWAPFHYGRWYYDNFYGWAWVPGMEWGPAWVNWRTSNGYYGWAPLGPGIHIHMAVNVPMNHWVFVPYGYITHRRVYNYYVPRRRIVQVYNQSVVINNVYTTNNYTYISGPSRNDIERTTRRKVVVRGVDNAQSPNRTVVNRSTVQIYRPAVTDNTSTARPARITQTDGPSRRASGGSEGSTTEMNNDRTRTNAPNTGRRENATGNADRERSAAPANDPNNRMRQENQSTPAPRRSENQEAPVQRRQETQAAPVERRQETQSTPGQRRQETQEAPAQRRQQTQSAPVERRQETQSAPSPRRAETQQPAPTQRQEAPQQKSVERSKPDPSNQPPARRGRAQ